jgi:hypothetical protein
VVVVRVEQPRENEAFEDAELGRKMAAVVGVVEGRRQNVRFMKKKLEEGVGCGWCTGGAVLWTFGLPRTSADAV